VGQGDLYQARYGTHGGNYEIIALSPSTIQETFDLIIEAFNLAEIFRTPVIFLMDEVIAHTREKLVIPPWEEIKPRIVERVRKPEVPPQEYKSFGHIATPGAASVPFPAAGDGYGLCLSPYTHNEKGYPSTAFRDQDRMVRRLIQKIRANMDRLVKFETAYLDDAQSAVVSYGCSARSALTAVKRLREEGIKIGFFRLITIWPFLDKQIYELAEAMNTLYVVECNLDGQLAREVQRASLGKAEVLHIGKAGVEMHTPEEIMEVVKKHMAVASGR
jgi:2-oxoglutarate ferredoxin oxidoreductase subunit alpha